MKQKITDGPSGHWFWGNLREFVDTPLSFLQELAQHGDLTHTKFGPFHGYLVNDPDLIRSLLIEHSQHVNKSRTIKVSMEDVIGANIFTGDGDFWKQQRKLMQPAFHSKRVGAYADAMVTQTEREVAGWRDGAALDIDRVMTDITMNIITMTMFDAEVGPESRRIGELFAEMFRVIDARMQRLFTSPHWLPTRENRHIHAVVAELEQFLQTIIDERRITDQDRGDLLSMLLLSTYDDGSRMSDQQIMYEAMTIFGAGHETTAAALTWAWYALAQNPDVREKLQHELDSVLAGRAPSLADLPNLPYTEQVIKETLRLYPPAWAFSRDVIETFELGGYEIRKGSIAIVSPWVLGRDERWYPDPLRFDPERWTPENEAQLPRYANIPFGGGPRVCIGNQFAMMEARLVLATIAQRYALHLQPNFETEPQRAFTLRPSNGMKMVAALRQPSLA